MSKKTLEFRHVFREVNYGNGSFKALVLQQFHEAEGWEHADYQAFDEKLQMYGSWEDIEIDTTA